MAVLGVALAGLSLIVAVVALTRTYIRDRRTDREATNARLLDLTLQVGAASSIRAIEAVREQIDALGADSPDYERQRDLLKQATAARSLAIIGESWKATAEQMKNLAAARLDYLEKTNPEAAKIFVHQRDRMVDFAEKFGLGGGEVENLSRDIDRGRPWPNTDSQ